ncbi:hypothetical protein BFP70_02830 [Thioclava sp. SK-1]|uniref:squalene/phytoene synthase family protein n=1 Tax=Thioclava sp. SK-1 TaxID=1889770 RepID=UPI000825CD48|nr:squalene/phytoene synthase family protein [Thioclava sp. SK-1]OCX67114.1 hypothetical protein BFP70_02830 [Thioclava sp. SK-1]
MSLSPAVLACAQTVQEGAPERFEALMIVPPALRETLWPLHALNLEIARAPWASKEPIVSEMRLQWWVDTIDRIEENEEVPPHPIGPALTVLRPYTAALRDLAEARRADCWPESFVDEAALWAYLGRTSGTLYWIGAQLAGAPMQYQARVRQFGEAAGLAAWLRAVPTLVERGRHPLPDGRPEAVGELARAGLDRLQAAKVPSLPRNIRHALVTGWETRPLLRRIYERPDRVHQDDFDGPEFRRRWAKLCAGFGRF